MAPKLDQEIWKYATKAPHSAVSKSTRLIYIRTADTPIRISPTMLLFPKPSALKEIYWDPKCNQKSGLYGSGVLGPPHLFTTLDPEVHKSLRKALAGPPVGSDSYVPGASWTYN
jgi:hypothetical protein